MLTFMHWVILRLYPRVERQLFENCFSMMKCCVLFMKSIYHDQNDSENSLMHSIFRDFILLRIYVKISLILSLILLKSSKKKWFLILMKKFFETNPMDFWKNKRNRWASLKVFKKVIMDTILLARFYIKNT